MKKVFPIMLSVLCLASCTKTGDNKSFYLAKNLDANSKVEATTTHVENVNNFLADSIKSINGMYDNENLVFSPLSYYISLASIYGLTYSNSSLDNFLIKTNLNSKEEIKDYVRTIMTNSNMEQKYDENNIATKERISNLMVGNIDKLSKDSLASCTDDFFTSFINNDKNMKKNVDKWVKEETNGLLDGLNLSLDDNDVGFVSALYFDSLYGMQLSEEEGVFKNNRCTVMSGDSYTNYHISTTDYEAVSFDLSSIENRGNYKIHFVKMLNNNSIKNLLSKYSFTELFNGNNKEINREKYSIKFPKNIQNSEIDLIKLASAQEIPFVNFEFSKDKTDLPSHSIVNFKQNNKIMFTDTGVRCSSTSAYYSVPTESPNFEFILDNDFAYTIEDPNGYIIYYGVTTSVNQNF